MMTSMFFILVTVFTKIASMLLNIPFFTLFIFSPLTWFAGFFLVVCAVQYVLNVKKFAAETYPSSRF